MFAFAEMTNMDPDYTGPEFDFDRIVKDLMNKVKRIKSSLLHENDNKLTLEQKENFPKIKSIQTNISGHSKEIISSRHLLHANKH